MYAFLRIVEHIIFPFRVLNGWLAKFSRFGGRMPKLTLAGKVSISFLLCFLLLITLIWVSNLFSSKTHNLPSALKWLPGSSGSTQTILAFIVYYLGSIVASIGVYWGIRWATLEKPSLYPEIDQCWTAMDQWRQDKGLNWHEFRRFLVLGPDLDISKAMHADMPDRAIGPLPAGVNEWMHWFGNEESVYLHLKKVCKLGATVQITGGSTKQSIGPIGHTHTLQASEDIANWSDGGFADSIDMSQDASFGESMATYGGSLDPNMSLDPYDSQDIPAGDEGKPADKAATTGDPEALADFGNEEGDRPVDRVRYLCDLMLNRTQGELPFHGIAVVIPFEKFNQPRNYKSLTASIKEDLTEIRKQTDLVFPVTFVFCSMEKDAGFPKLQSLLGSKRSSTGRFGAGSQLSDLPSLCKGNLQLQADRVCKTFETWVFDRWKKSSQVSRAAQNRELYKLVTRIRNQFQPKLEYLLEESLATGVSEVGQLAQQDPLFAGCYFVSTGSSKQERGFLTGVFSKSDEFAESTGWGDRVLERDRNYSIAGTLLFAISFLILIGIVFYLAWS